MWQGQCWSSYSYRLSYEPQIRHSLTKLGAAVLGSWHRFGDTVLDIAAFIPFLTNLSTGSLITLITLVLLVVPIAYIAVLAPGTQGRNARKVLAILLRRPPPKD